MPNSTNALLVMHYGTPASLDDVLPYYTHIRHGRPPSAEQLNNLVERYEAIGGPSPLTGISNLQAEALERSVRTHGVEARVYVSAKHTHPFIAEAVKKMAEDGVERVVGVVLAPHFSSFSVVAYRKYAEMARDEVAPGMSIEILDRWGALPELIEGLAERVEEAMRDWNSEETLVIFSAHSLPEKIVAAGDPYRDELNETSRLVADRLGLPHWTFAFQSASTTGEPWLGPDILDVLAEEGPRYKNIVACTVGFVSDHLEVLYDLGIEARDKCAELGLNFRRAATIGDDPRVMDALGGVLARMF